ncbi:MAG: RHS repeat-associated core domain-containing protein [Candidatus Diapherotrites archaeon]
MATARRLTYTWGQGLPGGIGGLLDLSQGGSHYSYLYDGKGNVTALLDDNANVAATYAYGPFGEPRVPSNYLQQPMQFSTKPYDEKTGLSYYGYRFYVPALGRWLTRDPLGEAGGINLYGFTGNNPINSIDPWGLTFDGPGWDIPEPRRFPGFNDPYLCRYPPGPGSNPEPPSPHRLPCPKPDRKKCNPYPYLACLCFCEVMCHTATAGHPFGWLPCAISCHIACEPLRRGCD